MALKKVFNQINGTTELQVSASTPDPVIRADSFVQFSRTDFALNNLFVYDDTDGGDTPLFSLRGSFPFSEIETFNHSAGNSLEYFPNIEDVQNIEIEMYEGSDNRVWKHFYAWYNSIKNVNGTYNLPYGQNGFKKDMVVYRVERMAGDYELGDDRQYRKVWGLHYRGVFPIGISDFQPDASGQDIVSWTLRLSADSVEPATGDDGLLDHFVIDDAQSLYNTANQLADSATSKTKAEIDSKKSTREKIADALNLKRNAMGKLEDKFGTQTAQTIGKLGTKASTVAHSLYFSKGRNFTNLGF